MSNSESQIRFDEAFGALVDYCAQMAPALMNWTGHMAGSARIATYGNDIWVPAIAQQFWRSRLPPGNDPTDQHYIPFYDAAWELCRIGVLRPGMHAAKGQGQIGGGVFSGDGYSITKFGAGWLANPDMRVSLDPSRMSEIFASFDKHFGTGFSQRATEAVRCHRTTNYLASCAMAGAAAESILLAVASAKANDEAKVLAEYGKAQGRLTVTRIVTTGISGALKRQFEAALGVLHYWRDSAAHGKATAISEVEAYAGLTQLLRLAQFSHDNWTELTR
jgi:hypothetical protein